MSVHSAVQYIRKAQRCHWGSVQRSLIARYSRDDSDWRNALQLAKDLGISVEGQVTITSSGCESGQQGFDSPMKVDKGWI